ncbi:MAG: TetR/AcrR family transcriptional regulator [Micromonosporaceae bacterium]|nr:TetR/AcrR family transcriptional regulator [Micromonosporaceae bacterium]
MKKPEERRADIVRAARHLFATNGFDGTSMQDVMRHLSIAKGTIYHYFSSKEDLLEAVVDDLATESTERMRDIAEAPTGDAVSKIQALVAAGRVADENQDLVRQLHRSANAGMHARLLAAVIQQQAPLYAKVFQQGREEGLFQVDSPLETAEFVLAAVQFLTDEGIFPWQPEALLRRAKAFPSLIEQQLGARPGTFSFLFPST